MKNGTREARREAAHVSKDDRTNTVDQVEPLNAGLRKSRRRIQLVWICLLLLAALTVGTAYIPLGAGNMALNILIAAIKVALIGTFFMHLAAPQLVPRMVCAIAATMLVVMFALSGVDYYTRDGNGGEPPRMSHP